MTVYIVRDWFGAPGTGATGETVGTVRKSASGWIAVKPDGLSLGPFYRTLKAASAALREFAAAERATKPVS